MLVIGDEILGGFVEDTNSGWVAGRLVAHAIPLTRIHTVPDEYGAIGEALHLELGRARPRLILTSGGIGSTPDDLTYEAIARALDRDLFEHPLMVERIEAALDWTRGFGLEITDEFAWHMLRMARIPEGAELLRHTGWAPGLRLDLAGGIEAEGATIVVLPGVPSQLRRIVTDIEEELFAGRNEPLDVVEISHSFPESALNLCFVRVMEDHPEVKLGSYPGVPMLVRLSGRPDAVAAAAADVRAHLADLTSQPGGQQLAAAWADRLGGVEKERR